jgi:hypothetical protein
MAVLDARVALQSIALCLGRRPLSFAAAIFYPLPYLSLARRRFLSLYLSQVAVSRRAFRIFFRVRVIRKDVTSAFHEQLLWGKHANSHTSEDNWLRLVLDKWFRAK